MLPCLKKSKEGTLIDIQVVAGSKQEGINYEKETGRLKVKISAPADKGKANKAILKKLGSVFGPCEITTGSLSKKKTILVRDADPVKIDQLINDIYID